MPTNVIMEAISPNSVALKWAPPDIAGEITEYVIYYMEDGNPPLMTDVVSPPGQYHTVEDLSEGTRYVMEVAARSNNGEGPKSVPQEVRTIDFSKSYAVELHAYM